MSKMVQRVKSPYVCGSPICQEQYEKAHPLVRDRYKNHHYCNDCRTCWPKTKRHCPCCGNGLRTKARSKKARMIKAGEYKRVD